jgi:hypothetical protein
MVTLWLGMTLLALVGGLLVLLRRPSRPREPDDRDQNMLDEAEREVRDLGATATPEDADDELQDWGPGTPK